MRVLPATLSNLHDRFPVRKPHVGEIARAILSNSRTKASRTEMQKTLDSPRRTFVSIDTRRMLLHRRRSPRQAHACTVAVQGKACSRGIGKGAFRPFVISGQRRSQCPI